MNDLLLLSEAPMRRIEPYLGVHQTGSRPFLEGQVRRHRAP